MPNHTVQEELINNDHFCFRIANLDRLCNIFCKTDILHNLASLMCTVLRVSHNKTPERLTGNHPPSHFSLS